MCSRAAVLLSLRVANNGCGSNKCAVVFVGLLGFGLPGARVSEARSRKPSKYSTLTARGNLDEEEGRQTLRYMNPNLTRDQIKSAISAADQNGAGIGDNESRATSFTT